MALRTPFFLLLLSACVRRSHGQTVEGHTITVGTIATSSASSVTASSTVSQAMPAVATAAFDSSSVSSTDVSAWCLSQQTTCPQICDGAASTNQCSTTSFTYDCVCANGTVPDCTAFTQTLPYFICQETYLQCIQANPNDADAQATCTTNHQCGTRDAAAEALAPESPASSASPSQSSASASTSTTRSSVSSSTRTTSSASSSHSSTIITSSTPQATNANSTAASPPSVPLRQPSSGQSTGAVAGIAVGSAPGGLAAAAVVFLVWWRRRNRRQSQAHSVGMETPIGKDSDTSTSQASTGDKAELYASRPEAGMRGARARDKSELPTNANRHELEWTVSANKPWARSDAELEG